MRIKLQNPIELIDIAKITGSNFPAENASITHITTDSRNVCKGDLFFAIKGQKNDGADYIDDASSAGAYSISETKGSTLTCDDSALALLRLAMHFLGNIEHLKYTIAITGSVGKTTTKEILSDLLSTKYKVHKTAGNENNIIGLSYTILTAPKDTEVLVAELGMNHAGEIAVLSEALSPDIAVITNVGTAHIGNLGSREAIASSKLEITRGLKGVLIVPNDEPLLSGYKNQLSIETVKLSNCSPKNTYLSQISERSYITFSAESDHLAKCISLAISTAVICNISETKIGDHLKYTEYNTRQKLIICDNYNIIDDSYNASFESFIAGIKYLTNLPGYTAYDVLIGDILELGEYSYKIHYDLGKVFSSYGINKIFCFGKYSYAVKDGALSDGLNAENIFVCDDLSHPEICAKQIIESVGKGEIIYAKASHATALWRVIEQLTASEKG